MNLSRRMALGAFAAMAGTAALARWAKPTVHLADQGPKVDLEAWFPSQFAGWQIDNRMPIVIPSPDTQALLSSIYNQTLARSYVSAQGQQVMLSVAYGGDQSDGTRAHRPEVCYPAQGFSITHNRVDALALPDHPLRLRRLMSNLGRRHEPITYWIMVGEQVATSGTEQKLAQLRYGVRGLVPDGLLMRVSSIDPDRDAGWRKQDAFILDLARAVPSAVRARLFGGVSAA